MKPKMIYRSFRISIILLLLISLLGPTTTWGKINGSTSSPTLVKKIKTNQVFIPMAARRFPFNTIFGIEMSGKITNNRGFQKVVEADASWTRRNSLLWSEVERVEGVYDWTNPSSIALEEELSLASKNGIELVLIVRSTPEWAQKIPGYSCGPIKPEKLRAFANFIFQAVRRYSYPPYNVKYIEIWNEVDSLPAAVKPDGAVGCWGDPNDEYYGGGYYADMLKEVYPKIKQANAHVQVLSGGLILDCDPKAQSCKNPAIDFLEGVIRHNGAFDGGNYLDIIAFHSFDYYYRDLGKYGNENWQTSWDDEGPAMSAKVAFIRELLSKYGVNLPIFVTEAALVCGTGKEDYCLTPEFEKTLVYYVPQLYGASLASGVHSTIWYSLRGWRKSGLIDSQLNPLPAYYAYKFARAKLGEVTFKRHIQEYSGIKGYEFEKAGGVIWLLWSPTGDRQIMLPSKPTSIWGPLGAPVTVSDKTYTVTIKPLYIEWNYR